MPTTELTFRTARDADVPGLVGLIESAYRGEVSRGGWTTEADLLEGPRTDLEDVAAAVRKESGRLLIAEWDGALIACCRIEHRGDHAHFGMFAVRPDLQGDGLGRMILTEAERTAQDLWDVREMRMTVIRQRTELIAWYERRGYRRTAEYTPFPYGEERFGIPQRPDLEFELLVKQLG
ncbi:GNAT family N-acetyltransferase [Streptomyces sp. NPDC058773]|uniref:GNAT family N-acetyltransferase n=1 Tax=Streptomyces sp. NPDC058773 TaxID=3346632 RepID=UPI0036A54CFF